jgi:hypothetical protein
MNRPLRLWAALLGLFASGLVHSAPVTILNPSFEVQTPELTSGQFTNNLEPDWKETGGPNNANAFMEWLNLLGEDGTDTLGMVQGQDVWQDTGAAWQAGKVYRLTVKVGNRNATFTVAGNQSTYGLATAAGTYVASRAVDGSTFQTAGNFADAPDLVIDPYEDPCLVLPTSGNVRVLLRAGGINRSHFDHIRLDVSDAAPAGRPAATLLAASGITSTAATLHGTVTGIGSAPPSVSFYYDLSDKGGLPASWASSVAVPGTQSGAFSAGISGLLPYTTYYYRARATNASGGVWAAPCLSFTTLANPPVADNVAASGIGGSGATVGANVTATGGQAPNVTIYYGPADGGTSAGAWAASVSIPSLTGTATRNLSGLAPATTYYFRAYAQNSGGSDWADSSATFTTLTVGPATVENRAADNVTGTSAELRGEVTSTGNDPPVITLYWGTTNGGTNPAAWAASRVLGPDSGDFGTLVQGLSQFTTYYYTARAQNAAGTAWASPSLSFTTGSALPNSVIINEVHYDPADVTKREEFIEFYNPTASPIDMSGWILDDGVDFTFPGGTIVPAGGYRVVAENLTAYAAAYPSAPAPVGTWTAGGRLSNSGERIRLKDAAGNEVDEVDYRAGFPWPTASKGGNVSMELLHPSLNNNIGGSWRASINTPDTVVIPRNSTGWRYRQTPSEPPATWNQFSFDDTGAEWATGGFPAGFIGGTAFNPPVTFATTLSFGADTNNRTRAYYFRKKFTLAAPAAMSLNLRRDDGAVVWINDDPVPAVVSADGTWNAPYPYTSLSPNATQVGVYLNYTLPASQFVAGENIIAIQLHQSSITSSDLLIDLDLAIRGPKGGSPGAANSVLAASSSAPPPAIRNVDHSPNLPAAGTPVVVSATITDPDNVGTATLTYQVVSPGSYIPRYTQPATPTFTPALNPAYETGWISLAMNDAGTGGDAVAGDGTFSATIPAGVQQHRTLVRYRIAATDTLTNAVTVPYADDEQVNFAYFCYNGVPGWSGAFRPATITAPVVGSTAIQNYPASLLNSIEPYHLIALDADVINCQYNNSASLDRPFSGTFVYKGQVFDNIFFKNRGIGSTYNTGKNKWSIKFNRTRDFQAYDNWGRPFRETWNSLSLDANAYPWASVFRGAAGIEEAASYRAHELAGAPSLRTTYVHFRVIRRAPEAATAGVATTESLGSGFDGQYSNDLFGLYMALEPTEANFIDERDLPDGNLYAIEGNNGDQKYQAANQPTGGADWNAFRTNLAAAGQTEAWYRANMDLPALYSFMGLGRLFGNVDVRPGDNYRFYHRSSDDRWVILAYDLDMMFIAATHWAGTIDGVIAGASPNAINAIKRHPGIALEFRNHCRELLSLMASDPAVSGGQIGQLLDEYAQMVNPAGQPLTWADLDAAMWNFHPRTTGSTNPTGQSSSRANFFRETFNDGGRGGLGGSIATGTWIRSIPNAGPGIGSHEGLTQWFTSYATNTYPANTRWTRKATNAGSFPGGTGADPDVNRQRGYGYKYLEWESLHGGYFNCTTNPTDGVAMGDLTAAGMTRYYAGDSQTALSAGNHVLYPDKPVITYSGSTGYPVNDILLHSSDYRDPQSDAIAAVQFRVGEISAPGIPLHDPTQPRIYEIEELWRSAEIPTSVGTNIADVRVPGDVLRAGHTYRARVRHKDSTGRWSFWSEPLQFVASLPDVSVYANALRITEINYNPGDVTPAEVANPGWNVLWNNEDFEFIELRNISGSPVDLTEVRFTKGIDFDFAPGTLLASGAYAVLVKNPAAFAIRYPGVTIAGTYGADNLANAGEEVKLSYGAGAAIIEFTYDDNAPWPATPDGDGPTLVLRTPLKPGLDHGQPAEWRASNVAYGSPGSSDGYNYNTWAAGYPGLGGKDADDDRDGSANRLEYAFASHPQQAGSNRIPTAQFVSVAGETYASLTFTRRIDAEDTWFGVQFGSDLAVWNIPGVLLSAVNNGDGTETQVWRSADPVSIQDRLYGRVLVTTLP